MPKLSEIRLERHEFIKLNSIPWFAEDANHPGLAAGGTYLLSGPPGGGKTTLALQIATDFASTGHKVLYLALEQSPSDIKHKIESQIFAHRRGNDPEAVRSTSWLDGLEKTREHIKRHQLLEQAEKRVGENLAIDASVSGMEGLPDFLARHVLGQKAPYAGVDLVVVDSLQGLGTAPTSSKPYQRLFEFNRWAKEHGFTVLLIGHITKGGAIAGPRSLEHNVDCVLYLRKAMRLRPLFVPKNRFGPERHEPLTLVMTNDGCLEKSKHVTAKASQAFGFLPGSPGDLIEVQALVKLPKYGDRPGIKAPYLPRQKLTQLVGIVSAMHDIDISDLTFEINCALPGGRPYHVTLDLPLAMSMLSSYFQREIPLGTLFVGELDLFQKIRPVSPAFCQALSRTLVPGEQSPLAHCVERLFIAAENAQEVGQSLAQNGVVINVTGVGTLDEVIRTIWPDVVESTGEAE
ncbi:MAG: ATPase domain-containing protein [bacterium]|jgi:DNA repair protein RadA/Sms|nr:AAA family ATPase [candidate division KSB1 bacterium]MDH7560167.1 ATPase domain-containing protein [bacterium]